MSNNLPYDLEKEEVDILEAFERGEFKSVPKLAARKKELQKIAKNTFNKTRNINIRLSERDLYRLKAKAMEEGIPYQTLASSILHKSTAR
jgi:predicted DNA binding CopG/RHH family protein